MTTNAAHRVRTGQQHPDFNLRPDTGLIWLDEMVIDPRHPERTPIIKITCESLWATIREGTFPRPVKRGQRSPCWRMGDVRDWVRKRDALNPATASPDDTPGDGYPPDQADAPRGASGSIAYLHACPPHVPVRCMPPRSAMSKKITAFRPIGEACAYSSSKRDSDSPGPWENFAESLAPCLSGHICSAWSGSGGLQ